MDSIKEKNNILESLYESNDFSLNYASLLVSYPYTEDLDYKRGEVVGIDSKGYVLIKAEPGWIPRHPFIKRETNLDYETWAVLTSVDL